MGRVDSKFNLFLDNGGAAIQLSPESVTQVRARPGAKYRIVDGVDLETARVVRDVVVLREGNDLVMYFVDGTTVVIIDYFIVSQDGDCAVALPGRGNRDKVDEAEDLKCEIIDVDRSLVHAAGNPAVVAEIVEANPHIAASFDSDCIEEDDDGVGWFWWALPVVGGAAGHALTERSDRRLMAKKKQLRYRGLLSTLHARLEPIPNTNSGR